jgi:hypothetical protein
MNLFENPCMITNLVGKFKKFHDGIEGKKYFENISFNYTSHNLWECHEISQK